MLAPFRGCRRERSPLVRSAERGDGRRRVPGRRGARRTVDDGDAGFGWGVGSGGGLGFGGGCGFGWDVGYGGVVEFGGGVEFGWDVGVGSDGGWFRLAAREERRDGAGGQPDPDVPAALRRPAGR